jgi:tetratricopeptide (TPR) repeat protein
VRRWQDNTRARLAPRFASTSDTSSSSSSSDNSNTAPQKTQTTAAAAAPPSTPPPALRAAAAAFEDAVQQGLDPEEAAAAVAFGVADPAALSETQAKYAARVAARLAEAAAAERAAAAAKAAVFEAGKRAYARGEYRLAVKALDAALEQEGGPMSVVGGEVALWLALAQQASGDEEACIATYRSLEASHPSPRIRKQAADLRYIMEAPKLRVGRDERVALPDLGGPAERAAKGGERRRRPPPPPPASTTARKPARPMTWEERWAEEWRPPTLLRNRYVAVAAGVVGLGLAVYSALAK